MSAPIHPEQVRVTIRNLYSESVVVFVGQPHEVLERLREVFAWLHPPSPTLLALEHLVEAIDRVQCYSAEWDAVARERSRP